MLSEIIFSQYDEVGEEAHALNSADYDQFEGDNQAYIDWRMEVATPFFEEADEDDNGLLSEEEWVNLEIAITAWSAERYGTWYDFTD